jgi:ABC-type spermidine/putrescine transport system permease subunit I
MPLSSRLTWLLLAPALAVLLLVFVLPLGWFLVSSILELGDWSEISEQVADVLGSRAMSQSLLATAQIGLATTLLVLLIGYPLAYGMLKSGKIGFRVILACVLLPYFTSVIVRTYAWMVLLGRSGVMNQVLQELGITSLPLQLLYNRTAVVVGMTYVLLPYMVLTLFGAMRGVDPRLLQAAEGMGASGPRIFFRVFLPLTLHGVFAGVLLVFILAIGFFITPALMGAPEDMMAGMLIERQVELANNWPVAAIMSIILLVVTLSIYAVYSRFADLRKAVVA